jgi:hypothetical protein
MTKLSDIPFPLILDTSSGDIIRDFFNPALVASVRYDRGDTALYGYVWQLRV